jgi:hypothetical protein
LETVWWRLLGLAACCVGFGLGQGTPEFRAPLAGGSLSYFGVRPAEGAGRVPLVVVLPVSLERSAAESCLEQWRAAVVNRGWAIAVPHGRLPGGADWADGAVRLVEAALADAASKLDADAERVYLAASDAAAPAAFYIASRAPHLFAAVAALGGNPWDAIETNRLYGANTALTPVFWATDRAAAEPVLRKLKAAGFNVVLGAPEDARPEAAVAWFGERRLQRAAAKVDCETGNLAFGRCFWLQITRFDPAQRNDVLPVSRVPPSSGAYLELGRFSYSLRAPGPGVLVERLPDRYRGPLRVGDRIVAVAGRPVEDAAAYVALMDQMTEERPVAVMIQRGKERLRLETRVVLPRREESFTARAQAEWLPDAGELLVISRGVGEMRVDLPAGWTPVRVNWNGDEVGTADGPGCWVVGAGSPLRRCSP